MIHDGYTIQVHGCAVRPLGKFGRQIAKEYVYSRDFTGLERFLWAKPHFFGDDSALTADQKIDIAELMLASDAEEAYQNLRLFFEKFREQPLTMIRPCELCQQYWFDQETGTVVTRGDEPLKRPDYSVVSCETNEGCLKGHHEDPVRLLPVNQQVVRHFLTYAAAGLPDLERSCPITQRNWNLLKGIWDEPTLRHNLETLRAGLECQRVTVLRFPERSYVDKS